MPRSTQLLMLSGNVPVRKLSSVVNWVSAVQFPTDSGIGPLNVLLKIENALNAVQAPNALAGKVPFMRLLSTLKETSCVHEMTEEGSVPLISLEAALKLSMKQRSRQ